MLSINDLTYRIGGQVLLDDVQLQLPDGHRAALIGRNGSGKSTLFKLILGESQADGGTIRISNGMKIISVAQEVPGGAQTPLEFLLASDILFLRRISYACRVGRSSVPNARSIDAR